MLKEGAMPADWSPAKRRQKDLDATWMKRHGKCGVLQPEAAGALPAGGHRARIAPKMGRIAAAHGNSK
jgi:hypothetical protein